jgi:phosphoribosylformimino-5-aminoimidazole carboxamide ribotide isomerase
MRLYPAIDIINKKCVRLNQGLFDKVTVYNEDPAAQAVIWQNSGADFLHVVDLDGARYGSGRNNDVIQKIAESVSIPIQTGGGIRSIADIELKLKTGVNRVILGTAAVKNRSFISEAIARFGAERIVIGVDAKSGVVAVSGWVENSALSAVEFCKELKEIGVLTVIYTDISRDGMMRGPDLAGTRQIIHETGINVIASGGVSSLEDLKSIQALGAEGAIIGQALYIGAIDLREAIHLLR